MMKKHIILIAVCFLPFNLFAQEILHDLSDKSTSTLNEELRKQRDADDSTNERVSTLESNSGYSIILTHVNTDAADASTYYYGANYGVTVGTTFPEKSRFYIPFTGVIKKAYCNFQTNTVGTSETSSFYIRLNDTTDTLITASAVHSATATPISNTSLSISVAAGDFITIKWVTPTWVTNPLATRNPIVLWIET